MNTCRQVLALCFICFIPLLGFAEAPVVDDSENFAILDEAQAANPLPVANSRTKVNKYSDTEEEMALAQDNSTAQTSNNADFLSKLKEMQQELQELRGQLEVQAHDLKVLQQQQLSFYKDIDARFRNFTGNKTPNATQDISSSKPTNLDEDLTLAEPTRAQPINAPKTASLQASPSSVNAPTATMANHTNNPADEQISYLAAYDLVKNKRYDDAQVSMENFVTRYPKGGYTANAHYWLGELYMVKKNYPEAINHFELVLKNFSTSSKAAACSLKIGYALASSGKKEEAKQRLQQVVRNYPDTPTAQLAITKLMSINAVT